MNQQFNQIISMILENYKELQVLIPLGSVKKAVEGLNQEWRNSESEIRPMGAEKDIPQVVLQEVKVVREYALLVLAR